MISVVKLISGEELIADVQVIENKLSIKKPALLQLIPSRNEPQQIMVALMPYAQYVQDHTIDVELSKVLWQERPVDELYNQYNSMFGTGIQLV